MARLEETHQRLALNSGTSGLLAAYFGLGDGPGDEVLVAAYNYHAAASALLRLGAAALAVRLG